MTNLWQKRQQAIYLTNSYLSFLEKWWEYYWEEKTRGQALLPNPLILLAGDGRLERPTFGSGGQSISKSTPSESELVDRASQDSNLRPSD